MMWQCGTTATVTSYPWVKILFIAPESSEQSGLNCSSTSTEQLIVFVIENGLFEGESGMSGFSSYITL